MDGRVEPREAGPDAMPANPGGTLHLAQDPPALRGWVSPDPSAPASASDASDASGASDASDAEELPEIGLDIEGFPTHILTAEPLRDAQGRHRVTWPLPDMLRDGVPRRARAFHMISGLELDGSPLTLLAHRAAGAPMPAEPERRTGMRWPEGLAGVRPAGMASLIADGLLAEAASPATGLRFELLAEAPLAKPPLAKPPLAEPPLAEPPLAEPPAGSGIPRGLRLLADAVASTVTLHIRLDPPAPGEAQPWRIIAWLPEATETQIRARFDILLERREGAGFKPLRRLRRGWVFRRPSEHPIELLLSAEEAEMLAEGGVWIGLRVEGAKGLSALLPEQGTQPLPEAPRFEDGRLDGAFAQAVEFLRVHGEARAEDHSLLPALWQAPPPSRAASRAAGGAHPFTQIILPIFNGGEEVKQCLEALRNGATGPMQVLMVDDGSRDFTAEMLRAQAAADPRFILHRRDSNRGYTKSINEGVLLTSADWVVVLNSDTIVPPSWLDRMHAAARARPGTGMVGPLSNAATWQSLPAAKRPDGSWSTNSMIAPHHLPQVQAILDRVSERAYPEFPVLNGFCTMISREVFDVVGPYDEDAFPMGYGEETDLCLRARRAGFRLTVADDCFVYHHKSVSFGSVARARLSRAGWLEMTNKHPGVVIPALERIMQDCVPLGQLRARLAHLGSELMQPEAGPV
ncbi:glycosyltransferase family 2 protein [Sediminicoccus sp. KRV36]|uniref:glycosyltransferase family 2 protein n=1 Tax=Sediminicoccus sp. KRV36 TaxID=3133721 RepID=UPI0020104A71|nr:glycosyltransferase family 2 protein [Sediminicoccus rosea]UPY37166.1 glycosyltransferase family 2 protein [Sediminicoccus rosea]